MSADAKETADRFVEPTGSLDEARERILRSAAECFKRFGVAKTTLEDIAGQAGISRATLYRTIPGGRDEIVLTVLLTEAGNSLMPIREEISKLPTFREQLIEGFAQSIEVARRDPNLVILFTSESLPSSVRIPGAIDAISTSLAAYIAPLAERARRSGELRSDLTDELIGEWMGRVSFTFFALPDKFSDDPDALRDYVATFVVPPLLSAVPVA